MFWKILLVFLVSMVPLIELRGAVPLAIGLEVGLPEWAVLIIAALGNIIPVPIIYLFARKVLEIGQKSRWKPFRNFCVFCLDKGQKSGDKLLKKAKSGVYFALFLFVAVPIPGTGAWTGTLAASILLSTVHVGVWGRRWGLKLPCSRAGANICFLVVRFRNF